MSPSHADARRFDDFARRKRGNRRSMAKQRREAYIAAAEKRGDMISTKTKARKIVEAAPAVPRARSTQRAGKARAEPSSGLDELWQAIAQDVDAMFAQIDRNLEAATHHLAAA